MYILVFLKFVFIYICTCSQKKHNIHLTWTSLEAQTVKNQRAMQETRVRSLGQEDPLEKEMATHSSVLAWRIPWTEEPGGYSPWGCKELDTTKQILFLGAPKSLQMVTAAMKLKDAYSLEGKL